MLGIIKTYINPDKLYMEYSNARCERRLDAITQRERSIFEHTRTRYIQDLKQEDTYRSIPKNVPNDSKYKPSAAAYSKDLALEFSNRLN